LGYVSNDTVDDDLVAAVHAALRGQRYVSGGISHVADETGPD
jgi:hypothetical protein